MPIVLSAPLPVLAVVTALGLAPLTGQASSPAIRYDGHQLIHAYPTSPAEHAYLRELGGDMHQHASSRERLVFSLPPGATPSLDHSGIAYHVVDPDIQQGIDAQRLKISERKSARPGQSPDPRQEYLTLDEVYSFVDQLAIDFPELVTIEEIGRSTEDRAIMAVTVSGRGLDKPAFLLNNMQHAREWLASAAGLCILDTLVEGYGSDELATYWLDRIEFMAIVNMNPDGYAYTHGRERLWRKNRGQPNSVDLNRNWSAGWGGPGSSGDPGSDTYRGPEAFSEPETQAARDFILAHPNIESSQDLHAYSSLILTPYGYTNDATHNADVYRMLSMDMAAAVRDTHGKRYKPQRAIDLYAASGIMVDWLHDDAETLAITIEVRGSNFVWPAEEIQPTCEEILASFYAHWAYMETQDPDDGDETGEETGDETGDESDSEASESADGSEDNDTNPSESSSESQDDGDGDGDGDEDEGDGDSDADGSGDTAQGDSGESGPVNDGEREGCNMAGSADVMAHTLSALLVGPRHSLSD